MKHRYKYEGPVMVNSNIAAIRWKGEVVAESIELAKQYIKNEFLKNNKNFNKNSRVYLTKKIIKMEAVM